MRTLSIQEMQIVGGGGSLDAANFGGGRGNTQSPSRSSSGKSPGPGTDGDRVNRADKRNRDGTKNTTWGALTHAVTQALDGTTWGIDGKGPNFSFSPNCGSCHGRDPFGGRATKNGGDGDSGGRGSK